MQRLNQLAEMAPCVETAVDVGCDHGYLSELMLKKGKAKRMIACDISAVCLQKTAELAESLRLPIETRCGDGLTVIHADEAQLGLIAGMGGKEILHILGDPLRCDGITDFIVSPHSELSFFRQHLQTCGLKITEERIVKERRHYYFLMRLNKGTQQYTQEECEFGLLIHNPTEVFLTYLAEQKSFLQRKLADYGEIRSLQAALSKVESILNKITETGRN